MSRWTAIGLAALLAAVACGVVAVATWDNCGIEGAYFDRSVGAPAYAGVFSSDCNSVTASNPHLWLGAAIAFAVMAVAILVATRLRRPAG